jgi:hypothetical protein
MLLADFELYFNMESLRSSLEAFIGSFIYIKISPIE